MFSQRSCRVAAPHDNRSAAAIHVDAQRSAISQDKSSYFRQRIRLAQPQNILHVEQAGIMRH
jgi:hypothetical protein